MNDDSIEYPSPTPPLSAVSTKTNAYRDTLKDRGSKVKTAAKKSARKALEDVLNKLGIYVQINCGNDEAKALRSGYDIRKKAEPVGDLPKPEKFTIEPGLNSHEIFASMKSYGYKAGTYVYRYTQDENSDPETWKTIVSTNPKVLIEGLESGKKVFVRGAGVGASNNLVWSHTISMYVQ